MPLAIGPLILPVACRDVQKGHVLIVGRCCTPPYVPLASPLDVHFFAAVFFAAVFFAVFASSLPPTCLTVTLSYPLGATV